MTAARILLATLLMLSCTVHAFAGKLRSTTPEHSNAAAVTTPQVMYHILVTEKQAKGAVRIVSQQTLITLDGMTTPVTIRARSGYPVACQPASGYADACGPGYTADKQMFMTLTPSVLNEDVAETRIDIDGTAVPAWTATKRLRNGEKTSILVDVPAVDGEGRSLGVENYIVDVVSYVVAPEQKPQASERNNSK